MLDQFLRDHTARDPGNRTPLRTLWVEFRDHIQANGLASWTRSQFVAELTGLGYQIGLDPYNVQWVVGIRRVGQQWLVKDGRLMSA